MSPLTRHRFFFLAFPCGWRELRPSWRELQPERRCQREVFGGQRYASGVRRLALASFMFAACNGGGSGMTVFSTSITTAPPESTASTSGETAGSTTTSSASGEDSTAGVSTASSTSSSSTSSGGIRDVGMVPDGGDGPPPGCKGKVDLLFTISSAKTMEGQQAKLKASFPGFVATLENEFADFDYHILSTNTFGSWVLPWCEGCGDVCAQTPEYPCTATLEPCDSVQGAGVTFPRGDNATNQRCDLTSGRRYIDTGQSSDLEHAFTCVASLGTNGADQVAEATVKAVADAINAPGGCNEGFLRPDALLVVVAIQDTGDQFSDGTAKDWRDALIDAKGGEADAVVLLVISTDVDDPAGLCGYDPPGVEHKLRTWTELMQPNARFGSICAGSYTDYFEAVAKMIKSQCEVFVPQ
ncbi:hypothetical protein [Nannocystis bainbridge]|uniref:VWFA domain-containing protein n=1 Tax=Nannocystis bainbridge TaxID=2995303 RepID=A0ABT5E7L9_9BACT|nr:hypothetical protein [Nannocystis bainbridge]MDC0721423.1 hypothetical protein [Nannocystis bainbridge]